MAQLITELELAQAVDRDGELPVGVQLVWRLRSLIRTGQLEAGERLPSVRELARICDVNANTARGAYSCLEAEGLIVSRPGAGTFVSDDVSAGPELSELAAEALAGAYRAGIEPDELAAAIYIASPPRPRESAPPHHPELPDLEGGDSRVGRQELRRQIARLEAQLASYSERPRASVDTRPAGPRQPTPHVAGLAELERTRDLLLAELKAAVQDAEARGRRQSAQRRRVERMAADPKRHKWEWVSSEDLGEPGCKNFDVAPRWGPVGAAMGWWRIRVSGGCPLAGAA
jgi:DNA-binding transcriptional regulator YhcF (GntR family)